MRDISIIDSSENWEDIHTQLTKNTKRYWRLIYYLSEENSLEVYISDRSAGIIGYEEESDELQRFTRFTERRNE